VNEQSTATLVHASNEDDLSRLPLPVQEALLPPPFDEEAALEYINHAVPSWEQAISKSFAKLVPKYSDTADWSDWCKTVQRFTSSGLRMFQDKSDGVSPCDICQLSTTI
jgi:hypothetical protein